MTTMPQATEDQHATRNGEGGRDTGAPTSILIVDDNPIDRFLANGIVSKARPCLVSLAQNGHEALSLLEERSASIVVTDLQMPGMSGLELVQAIRQLHPDTPVILMTGFGSEDVAMEALRAGASDYVPKQRLAKELPKTLDRILRLTRSVDLRRRCLDSLTFRESRFRLRSDLDLIRPLFELLQEEIMQLGLWDVTDRTRVGVALEEAISNALYHGNLEISSELKEEDDRAFFNLARLRVHEPPYSDRRIGLKIIHDRTGSLYEIEDEGPGFDTSRIDRPVEPEDLLRASGRGILLMRTFMDEVVYNEAGNRVTLIKKQAGRRVEWSPDQIATLETTAR